jgi:sugar phosphate isomerase/epimerase
MRTIRGPAVFLAQFIAPEPPYNSLDTLAQWAAEKGFAGVQVPIFNPTIFDIEKAAESDTYCEEVKGRLAEHGLVMTELASHRQGHLVALHPAYDETLDEFAPPAVRGNPRARQVWAVDQLMKCAKASKRLGLTRHVTLSGSLLWPYIYPYPPRPDSLVEEAYAELARRWRPILDAFDEAGVDVCFEIHPGEDVHDGASFERLLEAVAGHKRLNILYDPSHLFLQHMDYLGFIDGYRERIRAFHVKDAEWNRSPRVGVYGGYQEWIDRPGRFRSPGDGDIDFGAIFSKFAQYDYDGWAVLEWECCLKHPDEGARQGAAFIRGHIIKVQERAFDTLMKPAIEKARLARILGVGAS